MPCEHVEFKVGEETVRAIVCSRGRRRYCACGKPATRLCDYPDRTKRRKRSKTCDKPMCPGCAVNVGPDRDLCAAHARDARAAETPAALLADPDPHAMEVVADLVETRGVTLPCAPGDAAAAIANLERTLPKHEVGAFVVRTRSDVFDPEAVDYVLPRADFKPRDLADWQEFVAERAAIFEFLGEQPRAVADAKARQLAGPPPRYGQLGPLFGGAR